jgi:hypothetical protein
VGSIRGDRDDRTKGTRHSPQPLSDQE